MRVNSMIFIDRFVGIPACWILSQFHKIKKLLSLKKSTSYKKILFIKPSEMGTSVIVCPALEKARKLFPGVEISFLVFSENAEILKTLNIVDEKNIITIRHSTFFVFLRDVFSALLRIRSEKFDAVIDLEFFVRFTSILSYLSGAIKRVGFYPFNMRGLYRGDLLTHKVNYNYNVHCGVSFMSLVHALKYDEDEMPLREHIDIDELIIPKLKLDDRAKENILAKLKEENVEIDLTKKIVILNPNTSQLVPFRKWPIDYYISLAQKLIRDYSDVFIVVTGIKEDIPDGVKIYDAVNSNRCINLAGKTSIKELIDLFNVSNILISVDSGPAHFASLTDIKIVCIFGPDTPIIFSPLSKNCVSLTSGYVCNPCMTVFNDRKPVCIDEQKPCLRSISVDRVYDQVQNFITTS